MQFLMKKKLQVTCIAITLLVMFMPKTMAQTTDSSTSPWKIKWSGMVNPTFFADSRQVVSGREGMMLFYPKEPLLDANGNDLNATPELNMLSITARLGVAFTGPDVLGAHTRGYIEGDFTGSNDANINMLRLRHAYLDMQWKHSELLAGQYWHPMVVHESMPETQPLNMGAPFHPYARYNQLRYTQFMGKWQLIGVAAFQLDNKSKGIDGSSTTYQKSGFVPELNLQLRYQNNHFLAGAAANLLVIRPRTYTINHDSTARHQINQTYSSPSFSLFAKYNFGQWTVKGQTLLSDNLYEPCSMGGYLEKTTFDALNNQYEFSYRPFTFTTYWIDLGRTMGKWRPGLFAGYAFNNNFGETFYANEQDYGRGYNIEYLYRIQPRIDYFAGNNLSFYIDVEYTFAHYGKKQTNIDSQGNTLSYYYKSYPINGVANTRLILGAVYAF